MDKNNFMRKQVFVQLCLFLSVELCSWAQSSTSLFSTSRWFRLSVTERGVYRIDASLLQQAGLDPKAVDPTKVQLYGQPGGMLPQSLSVSYPQTLQPYDSYLQHNGNNQWEEGEFLLFYAESPDSYSYSLEEKLYHYQRNLYSDTLYYFLSLKEEVGSRVSTSTTVEGTPVATLQQFDAYYAHEKDQRNLLRSGRRWYGETLNNTDLQLRFDIGIEPVVGTEIVLQSAAAASCTTPCSLELSLQGQPLGAHNFSPITRGFYDRVGWHSKQTLRRSEAEATSLSLQYAFIGGDAGSRAYLDYFFVQLKARLHYGTQGPLFFRNVRSASAELLAYQISTERVPFALWEVSDASQVQQLPFQLQGSELSFLHQSKSTRLAEFVLFSIEDTRHPHYMRAVANQSPSSEAELLIVSAEQLTTQAERLADFHRRHDNMQVEVISTRQLYLEVSAGRPDPIAIRNYTARLHRDGDLKHLLLFGAATFDYKEILQETPTHVPTYQSESSLDPVTTYASDDYFSFLEPSEGTWRESPPEDHSMDIGVGRLPARDLREATTMVDKIIHYATETSTLGDWRQQIHFVADDGDNNLHHRDIEKISAHIDRLAPTFRAKKLYLDNYPQEQNGAIQRSPSASAALDEVIRDGALVVNFSGHGNTSVWTAERLLSRSQIHTWRNLDRLPLFITATCDFGRHDDPEFQSAGEELLVHPTGGGIALLSTARPVRADANFKLNNALIQALFARLPSGDYPRLGDIQRNTKNNSILGVGNRSFTLLGDPALRLNYPKHQLRITRINGTSLEEFNDTLRARSRVTLEGEVHSQQGKLLNYEGTIQLVVYDKRSSVRTLGDENPPFSYMRRNSLIFQGSVSVKQGRFSTTYVIPQSISYRKGQGSMFFYLHPEEGIGDAAGGLSAIYIGGPAAVGTQDNEGPSVGAYLDEKLLTNGLRVGPQPQLRLTLSDPQGIKLSRSGLAKNLSISIDEQSPVLLSRLYRSELDSYQQGMLHYNLERLSDGKHTLRIQIWDNYDNLTEYSRYFYTSSHTPIQLLDVATYPNPTKGKVFFSFSHDKGDHSLQVSLRLSNLEGKQVAKKTWLTFGGSSLQVVKLAWNLKNEVYLQEGIYAYQLDVLDQEDETRGRAVGKLVVGH